MKKQKTLNTENIKPSREFDQVEYSLYLEYATAEELEQDKITSQTAKKIIYETDEEMSTCSYSYYRWLYG
jgi:hypothetical protein